MKTKEEIEKRLRKLRVRYANKHVLASQQRTFTNCVHNREHTPSPTRQARPAGRDLPMVPRRQVTLVVLQDDVPVHLCMFGADDPSKWRGDVCDNDSISRSCKLFQPSCSLEEAKEEFMGLMADDEYVFTNFRDVATLQWVLGERVHSIPLTLAERIGLWARSLFVRTPPALPAPATPDLPSDLWSETNDDSSQNSGP